MTDRIGAIRARLSNANGLGLDEVVARHYREDVPWLLAEVDSLRLSLEYQDGQTASLHGVIAELRAVGAEACTQIGCQAIDRTNEAEAALAGALQLLHDKADSYMDDSRVLDDLGTTAEQGGGLTGEQWAIVYRVVATELRKCANEST
ncbi:MAG: hypothetical protein ACRDS9_17925 [Pseudonocardiaceae bacterium]